HVGDVDVAEDDVELALVRAPDGRAPFQHHLDLVAPPPEQTGAAPRETSVIVDDEDDGAVGALVRQTVSFNDPGCVHLYPRAARLLRSLHRWVRREIEM